MNGRPDTQYSQRPHEGMNETETWSPGARSLTLSPTDSTTPEPSWPPMKGNIESTPKRESTSGGAVMSPTRLCSSEWHSPA